MTTLFIHGNKFSPMQNKIVVAAKYANVELDIQDPEDSETYKLNCHPLGKAPALFTSEGAVFESNAILRYIARLDKTNYLYGKTAVEAGQVDQWIDFSSTELNDKSTPMTYMAFGFMDKDEAVIAKSTAELVEVFAGLEKWLEIRTFLVGERVSAADIAVVFALDAIFRWAPTADQFFKFQNVVRYYKTVFEQPTLLAALDAEHPKAIAKPAKKVKEAKPAAAAAADDKRTAMAKVQILCGVVLEVTEHPDSETLFVEKIDLGEAEPRTIISGLIGHITKEQFVGARVCVAANLDPRKMRGIVSAGMVLCACSEGKGEVKLLEVPAGVPVGERITFPGHEGAAEPVLKKKLAKNWDDVAGELKTDDKGVATYAGLAFNTSKGPVTAQLKNAIVS